MHQIDEHGTMNGMEIKDDGQLVKPGLTEERLWAVVNENPADFTAWTELFQETDKLNNLDINLDTIRTYYDTFLSEFPLCYGYWKKYADYEKAEPVSEKSLEIYERAVKAVTHSVEIWMHYVMYAIEKFEDPQEIRKLFERAISVVGTDYLSHILWDKYLEYEISRQNWSGVAQIHTRVLQIPLQQLDKYLSSFKQDVATRPLSELRKSEENAAGAAATPADDMMNTDNPASTADADSAELEKYVAIREEMYKKTKEFDAKIREFELGIRRPYFHVKPLDDQQLGNWHRYLDFMEKEGDLEKCVKTYERCLIPCASYTAFWMRYVQYMQGKNIEVANEALDRATQVLVKKQPEIHLFAARFKELQNDSNGARKEYNLLTNELAPGLLEAYVKSANFERRQANLEGAFYVFESAIESQANNADSRVLAGLCAQYANFLNQVGLLDKAKEVVHSALAKLPYVKLVVEWITPGEKQLQKLDEIIERVTSADNSAMTANDREDISTAFLKLLDTHGDIQTVKKAEFRHERLFPFRKSIIEAKRRLLCADSNSKKNSSSYPSFYGMQWAQQQQQQYAAWPHQPSPQTTVPQQWATYSQQGYASATAATTPVAYPGYTAYAAPQQPQPQAQPQPYYTQSYQVEE